MSNVKAHQSVDGNRTISALGQTAEEKKKNGGKATNTNSLSSCGDKASALFRFSSRPPPGFTMSFHYCKRYTPFLENRKLSRYINAENLLRHCEGITRPDPFIRLFLTIIVFLFVLFFFFSIKRRCLYSRVLRLRQTQYDDISQRLTVTSDKRMSNKLTFNSSVSRNRITYVISNVILFV